MAIYIWIEQVIFAYSDDWCEKLSGFSKPTGNLELITHTLTLLASLSITYQLPTSYFLEKKNALISYLPSNLLNYIG